MRLAASFVGGGEAGKRGIARAGFSIEENRRAGRPFSSAPSCGPSQNDSTGPPFLPVCTTTIEVAQFDIQKIVILRSRGNLSGRATTRLLEHPRVCSFPRSHGCQWCLGKSKDKILNVHHIQSRKTGGNSPDNLITLCETCHDLFIELFRKTRFRARARGFREATQIGIIRWRMYEEAKAMFTNVHLTYGYLTKHTRISHQLEKSHLVDARCISGNPLARSDDSWHLIKWVRRNNRQLHKATIRKGGKRKQNTAPKYVQGFRLFDCVRYRGQVCFVFGRRTSGYFDIRTLDGTRINASANCKQLTVVQRASACLVESRGGISPDT